MPSKTKRDTLATKQGKNKKEKKGKGKKITDREDDDSGRGVS